jgi:hypothetical protein
VLETQTEADRRELLAELRECAKPVLLTLTTALAQHSAEAAELKMDQRAIAELLRRRLPEPPADSLFGLLRTRALSLPKDASARSPLQMLDARYGVVPFDDASRTRELNECP